MALLGQIRKQTGLLIVTIGIAMLAFVAGDIFSENSFLRRFFAGDPNEVGNVAGQSISIAEYINAQNRLQSNPNLTQNQISQQVWDGLVSDKIIGSLAEKAGLEVTDEEVWEFMAPRYGMSSADELKTTIGQLKAQAEQGVEGTRAAYQNFIAEFEGSKPQILRTKYLDLVNMGSLATHEEAKFQQGSNIQKVTFDYGFLSYDDLKDKYDIEITDSEIEAYMKKHQKTYEQDATVDLSYVYFPGTASKKDEDRILNNLKKHMELSIVHDSINNITDTIPSFASAKNDSIYVSKYSDAPFNPQYITRKDLEQFKAQLPEDYYNFLSTANVGQVGGPFKVGETFQLVKMSKTKEIADSIKSSHILISYAGTDVASRNPDITRTRAQAQELADSILDMANSGNFKSLVSQYSEDEGSKIQDGSIGWTARNSQGIAAEYLQFLNTHSTGDIGMTESQFGFHIIKIDGTKNTTGYQIANIIKEISASSETSEENFTNARNFAGEVQGKSLNDFANIASEKDYNYNTADNVTRFHQRPLVDPSTGFANDKDEDILKWAFNKKTKPGSTGLFTTVDEDQIIVYLVDRRAKGLPPAKAVRDKVEPILEKQKLTDMINEKLGEGASADSYISQFGAERGNSSSTFGEAQIEERGVEPLVVGTAFGIPSGKSSKAIAGNAGIYVVDVKSIAQKPDVKDAEFLIEQLNNQQKQQISQGLVKSIIDASDVKDSRSERLDRQQFQQPE